MRKKTEKRKKMPLVRALASRLPSRFVLPPPSASARSHPLQSAPVRSRPLPSASFRFHPLLSACVHLRPLPSASVRFHPLPSVFRSFHASEHREKRERGNLWANSGFLVKTRSKRFRRFLRLRETIKSSRKKAVNYGRKARENANEPHKYH